MLTMGYSFRPWLRVRSNGHHFIEQQLRRAGSTGETELPERKLRATAEVRRQAPELPLSVAGRSNRSGGTHRRLADALETKVATKLGRREHASKRTRRSRSAGSSSQIQTERRMRGCLLRELAFPRLQDRLGKATFGQVRFLAGMEKLSSADDWAIPLQGGDFK
jgi:hypothetical protein